MCAQIPTKPMYTAISKAQCISPTSAPTMVNRWTPAPSMSTVRTNCAAVVSHGKIYVFGGAKDKSAECFDPTTRAWKPIADMLHKKGWMPAVAVGTDIYVLGGYSGDTSTYLKSVERYSVVSNKWAAAKDMTAARAAFAATTNNGIIYVMGGGYGAVCLAIAEMFNPRTNSWSPLTQMPTPRRYFSSIAISDSIYVFGGMHPDPKDSKKTVYPGRVHAFNTTSLTWKNITTQPIARCGLSTVVLRNTIYVMGGSDATNTFRSVSALILAYLMPSGCLAHT